MIGQIEKVLEALNGAKVRYLVVGGVAVVLHGHLRTTKDLDLLIQLREDNLRKALRALEDLGLQPLVPSPVEAMVDPEVRAQWIHEKNMMVYSMWQPSEPLWKVDIFVDEPIEFDAAYERSVRVKLDNTEVPVLALADLIPMKVQAGRPQDLADVEVLRLIEARRWKDSDE